MASDTYDEILRKAQSLPLEEQLQLLEALASHVRSQLAPERKKHSILELEGLGKEIWAGIDTDEYLRQERASWDREFHN